MASELELQVQLHPAWGLGRNWPAEKRRGLGSNVSHVVGVVQHIERVQRDRENPSFVLGFGEWEIVGQIEVEIDQSRASHGIARNANRPVIEVAIVIVIAARGDVDWLA